MQDKTILAHNLDLDQLVDISKIFYRWRYIFFGLIRRNVPLVEDRDLERAPFDKWACNLGRMV